MLPQVIPSSKLYCWVMVPFGVASYHPETELGVMVPNVLTQVGTVHVAPVGAVFAATVNVPQLAISLTAPRGSVPRILTG